MSSFSRFQQRNKSHSIATDKANAKFIFAGYPTAKIADVNGNEITAAVVNRQEKDCAYIYTRPCECLKIGSIWSVKGLHFLISEEIITIKNVKWRKYIAILCNVEVDNTWGYFKGPEESYINVALKQDVIVQSQQKPILVLPENTLNFEDRISIKGRGWMVQEYDSISTPGISYYSLRPSTISKEITKEAEEQNEDVYIETAEKITPSIEDNSTEFDEENDLTICYVSSTSENEIATENGFFKSSKSEIIIKARTSNKVVFIMPFGVDEVEIQVKENGDVVKYLYRHVEE